MNITIKQYGGEEMISIDKPLRLDDCNLCAMGYETVSSALESKTENGLNSHCFRVLHVLEGVGKLYIRDSADGLCKGEVKMLFPFDVFRIEATGDSDLKYAYIDIDVMRSKFESEFDRIRTDGINNINRDFSDDGITEIIESLFEELDTDEKAYSKELVSLLVSQIMVHILRASKKRKVIPFEENDGSFELCVRLMNYIDSNIYSIKNLREAADALGYNYCYLSSVFKRTTGTTLIAYYKTTRMQLARILLEREKKTVSEVAEILNYSSVYAFSKAFKEYFGMSPTIYVSKTGSK